jgi:hypothetical protein
MHNRWQLHPQQQQQCLHNASKVKGDMIMKNVFKIVTLLALSAMLAIPVVSQAADKKTKNEIVMKMGNKVHLFHSSNVEAQKEIAIGDVLPVYRQYVKPRMQKNDAPTRAEKEVGEVKVLSFTGEHYFEAEVIKGEVKIGDVAKKDASSLLVQPAK